MAFADLEKGRRLRGRGECPPFEARRRDWNSADQHRARASHGLHRTLARDAFARARPPFVLPHRRSASRGRVTPS